MGGDAALGIQSILSVSQWAAELKPIAGFLSYGAPVRFCRSDLAFQFSVSGSQAQMKP